MTNPTLEKVARAIAEAMLGRPVAAAFITEPCTGGAAYVDAARAALQSLRQVDDETIQAAFSDGEDPGYREDWNTLLDHILTEGGEG